MHTRKNFMDKPDPLNDYLFLKVMGEKGDEEQLLSFLNAVLCQQPNRLVSVEILENKILSPQILGDKSSVLDVLAELEDRTKVNIEVQIRNLGNTEKRSLYYWSREYTRNLSSGQDYKELPKVIEINIVDFNFLNTANFHTVFRLREDTEHDLILTDALEIHFVNMVKFRRLKDTDITNNPLHRWLTYLDKYSPAVIIREVTKMDGAIRKAKEKQSIVLSEYMARREYEMRLMALSDQTSMVNYARREGMTKGHAKAKREDAKKMKELGCSVQLIAEVTGLSEKEIEKY